MSVKGLRATSLILVILGSAALTWFALRFTTKTHPRAHSRIGIPDLPLSLARGRAGQVLDGSFQLRNNGTAPLDYVLTPSCGCSELNPRSGSIPPAGFQDVHVGIRLADEGAEKAVNISIQTDDPDHPTVTYLVMAYCTAPLSLNPPTANFGSIARGQPAEMKIRVRDEQDEPLGVKSQLRFEADSPYIVALATTDESGDSRLVVSLSSETPAGWFSGRVRLQLPHQDRDVELPVMANVQGAILASPSTLFLDPDANGTAESVVFVWRPDGKLLGKVASVESPRGLLVKELGNEADRRRRFRVTSQGDATVAPQSIRLKFTEVAEPAVIQVRAARSGPAVPLTGATRPTKETER